MNARFVSHLVVALVAMTAVILQIYQVASHAPEGQLLGELIKMISFFTFLSNALIAVVMTIATFWPHSFAASARWRGAMFVYITIVALIYHPFLSSGHITFGLDTFINLSFHSFVPVLYFLDWILCADKKGLRAVDALKWLIFPMVYFVFIQIGGEITGWYPFPFLDPNEIGVKGVTASIAMLLLIFYIAGFAVYIIGKRHPGTV